MDSMLHYLNEISGKGKTDPTIKTKKPLPDDADTTDEKDPTDYSIDDDSLDDNPDEGGDPKDESTPDDGTDYSINDDDQNTDEPDPDNTDVPSDDTSDTDVEDTPALPDSGSKMKTLQLHRTFQTMYNGMSTILCDINEINPRDTMESNLLKNVVRNLNKTRNTLYDYITIQFSTKTYEENMTNLYFFKTSVELCTKIIEKIKLFRDDL